jgi:hypothetical protein
LEFSHRQAWCWQDEWFGLQISDIRRLELETQKALAEKMGVVADNEDESSDTNRNATYCDDRPKIPISKSEDAVSTKSDSKSMSGSNMVFLKPKIFLIKSTL